MKINRKPPLVMLPLRLFSSVFALSCFVFPFALPGFSLEPEMKTPKRRPLVAVMVSDSFYDADKLLPTMVRRLADENGWQVAVIHGHGSERFENLDILDRADTLVLYIRRLSLQKEQLDAVKRYLASGRGLVGLRTASHGFDSGKTPKEGHENWKEFDEKILGGQYHGHGRNELGCDVENVAEHRDSIILKDVAPARWHSESSLYYTAPIADDATVYQRGSSSQAEAVPLTWTRMAGKSRVAYSSLGHQKDFEQPAFESLLRNLIRWTLEKPR